MRTTTRTRALKSSAKKSLVQIEPQQVQSREEDQERRASEYDCSQRCAPRSQRDTMIYVFRAEVVCPRLVEISPRVVKLGLV